MVNPKISLILTLPGGVMMSQQVAENKPEFTKEGKVVLKNYGSKKNPTVISFRTRKSIPAKQVWKMPQEAYQEMLEVPTDMKYSRIILIGGKPTTVWKTFTEESRIKKHCEKIAYDMGAIDFSFNILED